MATVISKDEAYSHMVDILDRALGGEEIAIEQGGSIRLKLVPVEASTGPSPSRRAGILAGRIVESPGVWDPLTDADWRRWASEPLPARYARPAVVVQPTGSVEPHRDGRDRR